MNRKTDKRKKAEATRDDREFSVGPVHVRRRGNKVEWTNNASPREFVAMRAALTKWKSDAPEQFRREADEVTAAVRHIDPLTVLGVVFFDRHLGPLIVGKPTDETYAIVEHIALLLAKDAKNHGEDDGQQIVLDQTAGEALDRYLTTHLREALEFAFPDPTDESFDDVLAECIVNVAGWEMAVRMPRFDHHQKALLHALFDPFAGTLRARLGFSCADAMTLESAFIRRIQDTGQEGATMAHDFLGNIERALRGTSAESEGAALADLFRERSPADPMTAARVAMGAWLGFRTGQSLSITAADGEAETGLGEATVSRLLVALATTHHDLGDYSHIVPMSPLKRKPLVQIGESYIMPSPALFLPALQTLFEDDLKRSDAWHGYEAHRSEFSEQRAAELISRVLPGAIVFRNLNYPDGELDVLVAFERRLFLIEVKGGGFAARARVGIGKLIKSNLRDLVAKAHEQSRRAAGFINGADEVTFKTDAGSVTVRRGDFDSVHRIAVTLEQIGHVVNGFGSAIATDPADVSWTVALDDLETITDVLVRPAQFVHYIERREEILRAPNVEGQDELGFLEWYLHTSLREIPGSDSEGPRVMMDATSAAIAAFEQAKGQGEHRSPPAQAVPAHIMELVDALAASRLPGWLDGGIALLALPHRLQRSLARQIEKIRQGGGKAEIGVASDDGQSGITIRIVEPDRTDGGASSGWVFIVDRSWRILQIQPPPPWSSP